MKILLTDIGQGRLSIAPELLNSSVRLHCRHHHRQYHSCSTSRSGPTPVCLLPLNTLQIRWQALSYASASPTPKSHLRHCRMASLLHILHPGAKIPSHSPSCTTSSYLRHKLSPPARGSMQRTETTSLPATSLIFSSRPLVPTTTLHRVLYRACKVPAFLLWLAAVAFATTNHWIKHTSCFSNTSRPP